MPAGTVATQAEQQAVPGREVPSARPGTHNLRRAARLVARALALPVALLATGVAIVATANWLAVLTGATYP